MLLGLVNLRATSNLTFVLHIVDILCELVEALAEFALLNRVHGIVTNHHTFVLEISKVGLGSHEEVL